MNTDSLILGYWKAKWKLLFYIGLYRGSIGFGLMENKMETTILDGVCGLGVIKG